MTRRQQIWLALAAVVLVIAVLFACRSPLTVPAYFVGPASYAVIVSPDGLPTSFYRVGDVPAVAMPGDSICVHFHADGNWQKIVLSNATWSRLEIQWVPHDVVRHVNLYFLGPDARGTTTEPRPC